VTANQATPLTLLAGLLLERAGLRIGQESHYGLKLATAARLEALKINSISEYVERLRGPGGEDELRALMPLVTVGHTEFFRDPRQFAALERRVLSELLMRARAEQRKLRIWSAGCATGEEPYSVAMLLHELGAQPSEVDIWATDVNPAAVEAAKKGRYTARRVSTLSAPRRQRYFAEIEDGRVEVRPELKALVRFDIQNLAATVFQDVGPASLDLILCRNVIIYFDLPTIRALMERFLQSLRPGGLLFLGYSESLFRVYEHFEMVEVEGAFVYRRPRVQPSPQSARASSTWLTPIRAPSAPPPTPAATSQLRPRLTSSGAWQGLARPALAPASSRSFTPSPRPQQLLAPIPALRPPAQTVAATSPIAAARSPIARLEAAAKLMHLGDFDGALAAVLALTRDEPDDLDALLTLGNLHSLLNHYAAAREVFSQASAKEPLCVEARRFAGLAAMQAGRTAEARSELARALFLEPTLAIGHYLLAQVEERLGETVAARRSYRNALSQLKVAQRPLAGHYPDMPDSEESLARAARYALAALEES